jgi:hypothetical protein
VPVLVDELNPEEECIVELLKEEYFQFLGFHEKHFYNNSYEYLSWYTKICITLSLKPVLATAVCILQTPYNVKLIAHPYNEVF